MVMIMVDRGCVGEDTGPAAKECQRHKVSVEGLWQGLRRSGVGVVRCWLEVLYVFDDW